MLICFICKEAIAKNIKVLFRHFKVAHNVSDINARYACNQNQCCRTFCSKYVFKRHVESFHAADIDINESMNVDKNASCSTEVLTSDYDDANQSNVVAVNQEGPSFAHESITELACKFICQAKLRTATLESVNKMVDACSEIMCAAIDDLHSEFQGFQSSQNENSRLKLDEKFKAYRDPFQGLKTQYQQAKYLTKFGINVEPKEYEIGRCQVILTDKRTRFPKSTLQKVTGQHVSITDTIVALNNNTDLIATAVNVKTNTNDLILNSFFDGKQWSRHPLRDQPVLVIRLYGDDFEPGNPLGSHKCSYKIGCMYYQFENLPSFMQSKIENIFLALCYHTEDVKRFGWPAVFKPLVEELKVLESSGVNIVVNQMSVNCKVVISGITGDNLFLNGVLGFVESSMAKHPCRHCTINRADFKIRTVEMAQEVRTSSSYDEAVQIGNVQDSGVKDVCVFNELIYFHAAENFVSDCMHDFLQGVCAYDVRLICKKLSKVCVPLHVLNSRMQSIDIGYHDQSSRPPVITSLDNDMLSFEAAEMWCFVRYLPAAIGDLVCEDNKFWQLYVQLRQIMDLVFSPQIHRHELDLLTILISEYLEMRLSLFPNETIKNKHHHMIHYPRLIAEVGPLSHFWCMRFEQKHQRFKRLTHITCNFKNLPKTIATRHQMDVASRLLLNCKEEADIGIGDSLMLCELDNGSAIDKLLGGNCLYVKFTKCNTVRVHGTLYKSGCWLVTSIDFETGMPSIARLSEILVRDRVEIFMVCEKVSTICFDSHLFSWSVEACKTQQYVLVNPFTLKYFIPHTLNSVKLSSEHMRGHQELSLLSLKYRL